MAWLALRWHVVASALACLSLSCFGLALSIQAMPCFAFALRCLGVPCPWPRHAVPVALPCPLDLRLPLALPCPLHLRLPLALPPRLSLA
ncbi:unnamed protein product, partial [Prunus brigantina]